MPVNRRKRKAKITLLPADPYESAKIAGLRYVASDLPGIRRRRSGHGWSYVQPGGQPLRDAGELRRIRSLAIPPAWRNVWICPARTGHLQAAGIDARGRKQYRYHPLYRQVRDATKFRRMAAFGEALPGIRARVEHDMRLSGTPREKVLAAVVRLLETTCIRVGNEEYKKQNESFGLTTLEASHVRIVGQTMRFHFRGKGGKMHDVELTDRGLARIVRDCRCIPGQELFRYLTEDGEPSKIGSEDVNDYLREIAGDDFTAKDFRTWSGTREALLALEALGPAESPGAARKNVAEAVKATAERLGNRPATCRKYYIHPAIIDAYTDGSLFDVLGGVQAQENPSGLRREEIAVMRLVARHTSAPVTKAGPEDLTCALRKSLNQAAVRRAS
jgi:DNA topoisomerase I